MRRLSGPRPSCGGASRSAFSVATCVLCWEDSTHDPTLEQPVELALEGPEDSVFVDDMRELLLGGCQYAAGEVCECELYL